MKAERRTDDEASILRKIRHREKYGKLIDFFRRPFYHFEQAPELSFIWGGILSGAAVLSAYVLFFSQAAFPVSWPAGIFSLESLLLLAALSFCLPFIYYEEKRQKRIETVEENLPAVLRGLSDLIAGGATLQQALAQISAKTNAVFVSPSKKSLTLSEEMHLISLKMKKGLSFEFCLKDLGKRYDSKLIRRTASVISAADRAGGQMHLSIDAAVFDLQEAVHLKKERDAKQSVFGTVLFLSFFLFIGIAVLLIRQFDSMASLSETSVPNTLNESTELIYRMLLIQAFFAGLMTGKLRKGRAAQGLKYAFILMSSVWISFVLSGVLHKI